MPLRLMWMCAFDRGFGASKHGSCTLKHCACLLHECELIYHVADVKMCIEDVKAASSLAGSLGNLFLLHFVLHYSNALDSNFWFDMAIIYYSNLSCIHQSVSHQAFITSSAIHHSFISHSSLHQPSISHSSV